MVGCWSCRSLPASCSRCSRSMPTLTVSPSGMSTCDLALAHDRRFELADLIALRQVRIEIVLPVEHRFEIDARVEAKAGAHRLADALLVDDRQHARHRGVDQRDVAELGCAAECGRGAGEQLRLRGDLGVDLEPDDDLPVAGGALEELSVACGLAHAEVIANSSACVNSQPAAGNATNAASQPHSFDSRIEPRGHHTAVTRWRNHDGADGRPGARAAAFRRAPAHARRCRSRPGRRSGRRMARRGGGSSRRSCETMRRFGLNDAQVAADFDIRRDHGAIGDPALSQRGGQRLERQQGAELTAPAQQRHRHGHRPRSRERRTALPEGRRQTADPRPVHSVARHAREQIDRTMVRIGYM